MKWHESFAGKTVVVTGASSGIGRETALAFGAAGARVAVVARRPLLLEEVRHAIESNGGTALVLPCDVTHEPSVRAALAAAVDRFGPLDIVVNNAGLLVPSDVAGMQASDLQAMLDVNLFGALYVMRSAVEHMRTCGDAGDGVVVNVASLAGRRGVTPIGGYCASKFALIGLTEALRTELRGSGIHVALVEPGVVDTPMAQSAALQSEFVDQWPERLQMPASWVVWAIFAAARFRLTEISVPPGMGTLEKVAALAPGAADSLVGWMRDAGSWLNDILGERR